MHNDCSRSKQFDLNASNQIWADEYLHITTSMDWIWCNKISLQTLIEIKKKCIIPYFILLEGIRIYFQRNATKCRMIKKKLIKKKLQLIGTGRYNTFICPTIVLYHAQNLLIIYINFSLLFVFLYYTLFCCCCCSFISRFMYLSWIASNAETISYIK